MRPCPTIWKIAPESAAPVPATMPRTTSARWLTEEYATSFFMSFWAAATHAP